MNSAKTSSGRASGSAARSKASPLSARGNRSGQRPARGSGAEAEAAWRLARGFGEGIADASRRWRAHPWSSGLRTLERPELIEEERPVGIGFEEGAELRGASDPASPSPSAASATAGISATRSRPGDRRSPGRALLALEVRIERRRLRSRHRRRSPRPSPCGSRAGRRPWRGSDQFLAGLLLALLAGEDGWIISDSVRIQITNAI